MVIKLEIDDAALNAAQAKADKLIATLKEAGDRTERLKELFIEMGELMAEVAAQEKPPEGGKEHVSPDSYREHPHAWNPTLYAEAERQLAQRMFQPPD